MENVYIFQSSKRSQIEHITSDFIDWLANAGVNQAVDMNLMTIVETIFQSVSCINASFITAEERITHCSPEYPNVDMTAVINAFTIIADMDNACLRNCVCHTKCQVHTPKSVHYRTIKSYSLSCYHFNKNDCI